MSRYRLALRGIDAVVRHTITPLGHLSMRLGGASIVRNVRYGQGPQHTLDIYLPRQPPSPCPAIFYVHGGGFTALTKDSYWGIARALLRMGQAVIVPSYRLAPEYPFPAALTDVAQAWSHIVTNAASWDLDKRRLFLAGESAGANLALGLTLATCSPLRSQAVEQVYPTETVPKAVLPLCGLLQVSDAARFRNTPQATPMAQARLHEIAQAYLGDAHAHFAAERALADPLVMLEDGYSAERPLPPMFIGVGAQDPIRADSERLAAALAKRGVKHTLQVYPDAGHAFFAVRRNAPAKAFWHDLEAFITTV